MIRRARCQWGLASDQYASCNHRPSHPPPHRSHHRRPRRRLWRHRHQSALRAEGSGQGRHPWRAADACGHPRRGVADPVGADPDHFDQIRAADPARGQPRRRRHRGAAGAALRAQRQARHMARAASRRRPGRRRPALWRRRHHAGDLGAERHRRPEGRRAVTGAGRGADHRRHPDRPVRHAEAGHRLHRQDIRPRDGRLVRRAGRARHPRHRQGARGARRAEPALCLRFPDPPEFPRQLRHSRRRVPRRHRRRSDVCRHGAFRTRADPARLVCRRAARAGAELFRTGGAADHRSRPRSKIRSSSSRRTGCITRWSRSPRSPP